MKGVPLCFCTVLRGKARFRFRSSWKKTVPMVPVQLRFPVPDPNLRWPDSRESIFRFTEICLILANRFRVPELKTFFANRTSGGLKIANCRFEAIRTNRSHVMKLGFFLRIDSRQSPQFALRMAGPSKIQAFGGRRKLQKTADFRRKAQDIADWGLSPLARPHTLKSLCVRMTLGVGF